MSSIDVPLHNGGFGRTARKDNWWIEPLLVFLGFSAFIVYSTWAALQGAHYTFGPYLSPFYSPLLMTDQARHGGRRSFRFRAAMLILWAPADSASPATTIAALTTKPSGPTRPPAPSASRARPIGANASFPLILQNIHRYFLYLALIFIVILAYDAYQALWFDGRRQHFGIGVGSLVLILNPILLGCYTFGCHSLRHLVGGRLDEMSKTPVRKSCYDCVSCLNRSHMMWAWISLFWVGFTDVYIRLCSMGIWHDWRIF